MYADGDGWWCGGILRYNGSHTVKNTSPIKLKPMTLVFRCPRRYYSLVLAVTQWPTFCSDLSPTLLKLPTAIKDPSLPIACGSQSNKKQRHQHYHIKGISTDSPPRFCLQIIVIFIHNHQFRPFLSPLKTPPSTKSPFKQNKRY